MKRFFFGVLFFLVVAIGNYSAQTLQISVPASACQGQDILALVTSTSASVALYSWTVYPSEQITTGLSATNTQVSISFTSCGNHTVVCSSYNSSAMFTGSTSTAINVICPGVTAFPAIQTICAGTTATISASGANSYTWSTSQNTNAINPMPLATTVYSVIGNTNACVGTATVYVNNTPTIYGPNFLCSNFTTTLTAFGSTSYTWTGSTLLNPVVQASVAVGPGTYTVASVPGSTLCTTSKTIGLAPPLIITTVISSPTTCIEQNFSYRGKYSFPVTINVGGASNYTWATNNPSTPIIAGSITVRPAVSTCYTVTGSTAVCSGSAVACVTVIPQFTMNVSPGSSTICLGDSVKLSIGNIQMPVTGGSLSLFTYTWWDPPTSPPPSITSQITPTVKAFPQVSSTYTAEVADARGCVSVPFLVAVNVTTCVDTYVPSIESSNGPFEVYPNPFSDLISITSKDEMSDLSVDLCDLVGEKIFEGKVVPDSSADACVFELHDLKPGIYFISIFSEGKIMCRTKVLKE